MRTSTLGIMMIVGVVAGFVGLHGSGCANSESNPESNGEGEKGTCALAEDDGNPCTEERCTNSDNPHLVTPDALCGKDMTLKCNANGECEGCSSADQCGAAPTCVIWICEMGTGTCKQEPLPDGMALDMSYQTPGDCDELQCDGKGGTKNVQLTLKTPCTTNGGQWCDSNGSCVECIDKVDCTGNSYCYQNRCYKCDDNIKDGNETDVDCGGSCPDKCAMSKNCIQGTDCVTSHCADGVCCDQACTNECRACNITKPGVTPGQCTTIEFNNPDNSGAMLCNNGYACDGNGHCNKAIGQQCNADAECINGVCKGDCSLNSSQHCVIDSNCTGPTNDCINRRCLAQFDQPCSTSSDCESNKCVMNKCQL